MKAVTPAYRLGALLGLTAVAVIGIAACSDAGSASLETLPSIRTTTTVPTTVPTPTTRPNTYEVQRGESLSDVARRFGLNWVELADYNGIENPDYVQAGDVIRLPPAEGDGGDQGQGSNAGAGN